MIEGSIWKTSPNTFNIQVEFDNSEYKEVDQILKDWHLTGSGFNKNTNINIFRKDFPDPDSCFAFLRTLPISLVIVDKDGKKIPVKTAVVKKKTTPQIRAKSVESTKQSGRCCGKCGKPGHNARTCK